MKFNSKLIGCLSMLALTAGCATTSGLDFDLRNTFGGRLDTSEAARGAVGARPTADARGIITYPNYQVAIAQRGDTVEDVAARIGVDAPQLAAHNGRSVTDRMLLGGVLALPGSIRASAPSTSTSNDTSVLKPTVVDVTELAPSATSAIASGPEPIRHRVAEGETAFTIARRYNVPATSIQEWNGLGSELLVRPGQILLIPVVIGGSQQTTALPGNGSLTPTPPSSTRPQPRDVTAVAAATTAAATTAAKQTTKPVADIGTTTKSSASSTRFVRPVEGRIIRDYKKGRNEGIDIGAAAGTSVSAADAGQVVAITKDTNGVPFLVVKHTKTLVTVYSNVSGIMVKQGQKVKRGQKLAVVQNGSPSFLHFEVRKGLDSIDPNEFF